MTSRTVLLGLVAWAAVVAGGAGVTWVVIDAAGQQVLGDNPVNLAAPTPTPFASLSPRPTAPAAPALPARDSSVVRVWRGTPGTVVARCRADAVSLDAATPADGYRAQVSSRGPREVEVTFAGGGRLTVRAVCANGQPSFSTEHAGVDD